MLKNLFGSNGKEQKNKKCIYIKDNGERCDAYSTNGSEYCVFHDPEKENQRREAKSHGGRKRSYQNFYTQDGELVDTPEKVLAGLSEVILNLKQQDNTATTARALIEAYKATLGVMEYTSLEERMKRLEDKVGVEQHV